MDDAGTATGKVVVHRTMSLDGFIAGPDPAVTFLSGDVGAAVATARKAAGGKNVEVFGADLTGQCLERGLIDEIVVHIVPVLLGTGTPFSTSASPARVDLEPVSSTHSGSVTTLRLRVRT